MSYNNRKENSYTNETLSYEDLRWDFLQSLGPNDRSAEYEMKIRNLGETRWDAIYILAELDGEQKLDPRSKKMLDIIITDDYRELLEKNHSIETIQNKLILLNLLLQLLERSSQLIPTKDEHYIKLSQSLYNCLEDAYLTNPDDIQSRNELKRLKDQRFIRIKSYFTPLFVDPDPPPSGKYRETIFSRMFDIIDIKPVKDLICEKIDEYYKEIDPWMKKVTPLLNVIKEAKEAAENISDTYPWEKEFIRTLFEENNLPHSVPNNITFNKTSEPAHVKQSLADDDITSGRTNS